jgi:hypothetical protein
VKHASGLKKKKQSDYGCGPTTVFYHDQLGVFHQPRTLVQVIEMRRIFRRKPKNEPVTECQVRFLAYPFNPSSSLNQFVQVTTHPPNATQRPTGYPGPSRTHYMPEGLLDEAPERNSEQRWKAAIDTEASEGLIEIKSYSAHEGDKTRIEYVPFAQAYH